MCLCFVAENGYYRKLLEMQNVPVTHEDQEEEAGLVDSEKGKTGHVVTTLLLRLCLDVASRPSRTWAV